MIGLLILVGLVASSLGGDCNTPEVPKCGENEVYSDKKFVCPPQSCESIYTTYLCANGEPEPGCNCINGYLRDANNICIPSDKCDIPGGSPTPVEPKPTPKPPKGCKGDPNAEFSDCTGCQPSCENLSPICAAVCGPPGCQCKTGYVLSNGKCILPKQCPAKGCKGDPNAEFRDCTGCQPSCENPNPICAAVCGPPGCQCKTGYVLSNGKCILPKQCPAKGCNGDPNAEFRDCTGCQPSCENPNPICAAVCRPPGCQCKTGYVLSNGKCILPKQCPAKGCNGDPNAEFRDCTGCQPSCENPNPICPAVCKPPGCQCKSGYVLSNGKCILPKQCPAKVCNADPNAEFRDCTGCQPSCENPNPVCPAVCEPPGCQCKSGYVLSNGKCILPKHCPVLPECGQNEVATNSRTICPPQSCEGIYTDFLCVPQPAEPGCDCIDGYLRNSKDVCIPKDDCPLPAPIQECGYNEVLTSSIRICPPEICDTLYQTPYPCAPPIKPPPAGCRCLDNYLRNSSGICIPKEQCPPPTVEISCPVNEQFVKCRVKCPTEYCPTSDTRARVICEPARPCPSGCVCKYGYLRKNRKENQCIEAAKCPPVKCTRPNEVWSPSPPNCLAERCEDVNKPPGPCNNQYLSFTPKCICQKGYYRNSDDICVAAHKCPNVGCNGDPHASWKECTSACPPTCENPNPICIKVCKPAGCVCNPGYVLSNGKCILLSKCPAPPCPIIPRCQPTCAVPTPRNCPKVQPATSNVDGCQCKEGYILSKTGGQCIKIEDCPKQTSCNGDPHAVLKSCPWACPPTCANPEAARTCTKKCPPVGCDCEPGYIFSKVNGKCILPDNCPGGNPCGKNGTYVECGFRCPNQYCPKDDSGIKVACKPGRPCPPGCGCKDNYKRLNFKDEHCVLASDCPPVKCTKQNEVWSSCPSDCLAESCANVNDPPPVCGKPSECDPKCICQKGFYRNSDGACIPAKDCPGYNPCASTCTPTCANPNPPNCDSEPVSTCCKNGYVLSKKGGKCIKTEDCPKNIGCNGDPNAIVKNCPAPCPSTCDSPNAFPCRKACKIIGCECAPGYLFNKEGKCVRPDQCPGGNPCRKNERFVSCKAPCPTDYCPLSDSRAVVACDPPSPCLSGCVCNLNYRRKSYKDDRCIVSSDCPPVKCTRQNEEWSSCPSACLSEYCDAVDQQPVVCNTLVLNCQPQCICCKNYFRNASDICVSADECRGTVPDDSCEGSDETD